MTDGLAQARKVYVDANICIYLVEGSETLRGLANRAVAMTMDNGIPLLSSELSYAECMYGVIKNGRTAEEAQYLQMFSASGLIEMAAINRAILDRAARWGGASGLKLIDSIHMATAIETGCDTYLTNDRRFQSAPGLRVIQLSDIGD